MTESAKKPYIGKSMEGAIATWYAKSTRKDMNEFERLADELSKNLQENSRILEVAPGPGYLCVALAKRGNYKITGLDISQTFVRLASEYSKKEGVRAHFIHGSASDIPLEDSFFDLVVCRAAFKNFSDPLEALNEMHRVLKPGAKAVIMDLKKDASWDDIVAYVNRLNLGKFESWFMKTTFKHMLLKRAYTLEAIELLVSRSDFKSCQIVDARVGMEIHLLRQQSCEQQAA
jgi:ubiquinone/menaquinone biosynthesis C-methylase UbiE